MNYNYSHRKSVCSRWRLKTLTLQNASFYSCSICQMSRRRTKQVSGIKINYRRIIVLTITCFYTCIAAWYDMLYCEFIPLIGATTSVTLSTFRDRLSNTATVSHFCSIFVNSLKINTRRSQLYNTVISYRLPSTWQCYRSVCVETGKRNGSKCSHRQIMTFCRQ